MHILKHFDKHFSHWVYSYDYKYTQRKLLDIFPRIWESLHTEKGETGKKKKCFVKPKLGMLEEQCQHVYLNTSVIQQCENMQISFYWNYTDISYEHIFYISEYFKLIFVMNVTLILLNGLNRLHI